MPFNGECGRELREPGEHLEEAIYCTECGTIFVKNTECYRRCPTCILSGMIEDVQERLDRVERDLDQIDSGGR